MKKILLLLSFFTFLVIADAGAQTKSKSTRKPSSSKNSKNKKEPENFWLDKMMYGSYIGTPSFGDGAFTMSLTPMIGYKATKNITIGGIARVNYWWFNAGAGQSPINIFEGGPGLFTRFKIANILFVHADYITQKSAYPDANDPRGYTKLKNNANNIGVGYLNGNGKWKYEVGVYYNRLWDSDLQFENSPWDFRIGVTYNF
jgi:hypothetical protein